MKKSLTDIPQVVPLGILAIAVAVFCVWPLAAMCAKSLDGGLSVAAARWASVLQDSLPYLGNSVFVATLASAMSCALGLCVALCIAYGPAWLRACLGGMTMVSMVSPPFIASLAYIQLFGKRGLITHDVLGLTVSPYGWLGIVIMQGLFFAPLTILMLQATLRRIDTRQFRAAEDLGASHSRVLRTIVLPLVGPTLAACFLLTFVRSMSDYGTPIIMGGPFETVSSQIYVQLIGYSDLPSVAVLDIVLLVIAAIVFYLRKRLDDRTETLVGGSGAQDAEAEPWRMTGPLAAAIEAVATLYLAFMILLYATIVRTAFVAGVGANAKFTLKHVEHLLEFNLTSLKRSVLYALGAAALATVLGACSAFFVHRRMAPGRTAFDFAASLPYLLPGTCLGLGYILAFNQPPLKLTGTGAIIVLVLAFKQLTIATNAFRTSMAQIGPEQDDAAASLGAGPVRTFVQVIAPQLRQAAAVSFINTFSSAMVGYGAVLFLMSPTNKTAIAELFDALSGGKYGNAAAIAIVLIAVTALANLLAWRLGSARKSERGA